MAGHATDTDAAGRSVLERRLDLAVFVAALMSIPAAAQSGELTGTILVVDILAWLVFLAEAVIKVRVYGRRRYLADRWNWVDVGIVVLSAPYHLATGIPVVATIGSLARLARLVRIGLVMTKVLRQGRRLLSRRNVPAASAVVALATFGVAMFVFWVERGAGNDGFESYGDSLWWALVTLTTVGYGDLAPATIAGRIGAIALMVVGVAFLGTVAASLASYFVEEEGASEGDITLLRREVAELRNSIEALTTRLER